MSVYVDPLLNHGGSSTFRWKLSCHLTADTEAELHAFAKQIGLKREWFQKSETSLPHYDITEPKRVYAVQLGAIEITSDALYRRLIEYRKARKAEKEEAKLAELIVYLTSLSPANFWLECRP